MASYLQHKHYLLFKYIHRAQEALSWITIVECELTQLYDMFMACVDCINLLHSPKAVKTHAKWIGFLKGTGSDSITSYILF